MIVNIIVGNCLEELRRMPAGSVHCVVTSPPYWGLRDYGIEPSVWGEDEGCAHVWIDETVSQDMRKGAGLEELSKRHRGGGKKWNGVKEVRVTVGCCSSCGAWRGAFGLEPTPEMFVEHLTLVCEEVRRVLRDDGTLWLNLGDSYYSPRYPGGVGENSTINGQGTQEELRKARRLQRGVFTGNKGYVQGNAHEPHRSAALEGLKPKDLVGVPWMAAFALRRAGWWLRQEIIWAKPNPMPESTTDRCTKAHEQLFMLAKSEHYFFDQEAIKEDASSNTNPRRAANYVPSGWATGTDRQHEEVEGRFHKRRKIADRESGIKNNDSFDAAMAAMTATRNKRSVWTVATKPFPEAHFATFPPELIEPCVLAGTSARGCCPTCAAPWERVTVSTTSHHSNSALAGNAIAGKGHVSPQVREDHDVRNGPIASVETIGWHPTCRCGGREHLPAVPRAPSKTWFDTEPEYESAKKAWRLERDAIVQRQRALCRAADGEETKPAVVLDPFGGAGTTGFVANKLQRDALLIERNPAYAEMAARRIRAEAGMLARVAIEDQPKEAAE